MNGSEQARLADVRKRLESFAQGVLAVMLPSWGLGGVMDVAVFLITAVSSVEGPPGQALPPEVIRLKEVAREGVKAMHRAANTGIVVPDHGALLPFRGPPKRGA